MILFLKASSYYNFIHNTRTFLTSSFVPWAERYLVLLIIEISRIH